MLPRGATGAGARYPVRHGVIRHCTGAGPVRNGADRTRSFDRTYHAGGTLPVQDARSRARSYAVDTDLRQGPAITPCANTHERLVPKSRLRSERDDVPGAVPCQLRARERSSGVGKMLETRGAKVVVPPLDARCMGPTGALSAAGRVAGLTGRQRRATRRLRRLGRHRSQCVKSFRSSPPIAASFIAIIGSMSKPATRHASMPPVSGNASLTPDKRNCLAIDTADTSRGHAQ
ncbi:hypothetical protein BSFP_062100 [Burkholderia stabilis]|uniref:Uncharacterized protein n=1 Tax=Burkholderia stabilis TaxID=95485 RepID=A0A1Y1C015_9BURK|nr:hypothetical protein BSFP_062100 [Burkholderia stabilis]